MTEDKEDGEYETKDLHDTNLIESLEVVILQCITESAHNEFSIPIVLRFLKMKQLARAKNPKEVKHMGVLVLQSKINTPSIQKRT